jgi:hypothetical protein
MNPNLKCLVALSVIGIGLLSAASVRAQDNYPWRPMQLVVTTAAGGALDLVARTVADRLSVSMNQPIIIENQRSRPRDTVLFSVVGGLASDRSNIEVFTCSHC